MVIIATPGAGRVRSLLTPVTAVDFFANAEPAERSSEGECDFAKVYARRTLVAFPARRPRRSNPVPSAAARMEARSEG